jgi:isoleucyl-tRNA synthetase
MYLEGSDQHRGWFQSSLLLSLAGNGGAPYKTVLTYGFVVDADREKISKSNQGQSSYEEPQTAEAYVKKYGADIVRLWVASQDFRNDIVVVTSALTKWEKPTASFAIHCTISSRTFMISIPLNTPCRTSY